jgi:tRNA-splicing ligase RtcB
MPPRRGGALYPGVMIGKAAATRHGEGHYVLPRSGAMRVDAHAFLSDALFEASEDELWRQLAAGASYPGVIGAYAMPDVHTGFGVPVGCVLVTEDTLVLAASGYDISCGVVALAVHLTAKAVRSWHRREAFVREVEQRVASGLGSGRPRLMPRFEAAEAEAILRHGALALGVPADRCERQFIPVPEGLDLDRVPAARQKVEAQLGSVGGGNHFIELQADRDTGEVFCMIHCGSRGYGWQTANHYFHEAARLRELPVRQREAAWLRVDEPLGREYWAHHNSAANYAIANRHVIVRGVQAALAEVFGAESEVYYEISHNLVQEETLVLPDGTQRRGFVHRKGATRAFPAGHPELVGTRWESTGHPVLVPGSMYDGAAVLFPEAGAYRSACSVNHGSGRRLARGAARRPLEHKQHRIDEEMRTARRSFGGTRVEGIVGNHRHTPLDECGHVYKDLDEVIRVLEAAGIARLARRLYPVANLKGAD